MENSKSGAKAKKASSKKSGPSGPEAPESAESAKVRNREAAEEVQRFRDEAWQLEMELEALILRDAVLSARLAIQDLNAETYSGQPYERRKGLRIREKAVRVDRAFNRLRALRKGDLLPMRLDDEF